MATFKLYGNLEPLVSDQPLEVQAVTVRAAIVELVQRFPALVGELVQSNGEYNRYYTLIVNGEMMEFLDDLNTQLAPTDEVTIFPPIAA